jgi:aminoglycoside phosphotransferase (APT) family kinase protein
MTSSAAVDRAREVREEDGFDIAAADAWLKDHVEGLAGAPEVTQFPGGASNLTFQLTYPGRELILRRPPTGKLPKSGHDMKREFTVQSRLKPVYPYVPNTVAFCDDHGVMGADFYVMDRIEGIILRSNLPKGFELAPGDAKQLSVSVIDRLIDLHQVDKDAAGLSELGRGDGYVERQIGGWSKRYRAARTRNVPSFEKVMSWLERNQPADSGNVIIHNDWRFDNVILDPGEPQRIIGVLDWEMATLGDPLMDLGSALAYWVEADDDRIRQSFRRQPTHLPGMLTRREVVEHYADRTGLPVENWAFYEVYGLFRLAGIIQQIYYRYYNKQTTNPAFKQFWIAVRYMDWRARKMIRQSGLK